MKIDAHIHFWRLARGDNTALTAAMRPIYRDLQPADLRPLLTAAGVDRIVVVQAAETLAETVFTLGLAARYDWIAGVVGWLDPASPAVAEEVAAFAAIDRLKGVRPVRDDNHSIAWMLDERVVPGWEELERSDLALEVLIQDWRELPLAVEFARRYPGLEIVIDHCAKPDIAGGHFDGWAGPITALAQLPHVNCKFSGLLGGAPAGAGADDLRRYADHVIASFGPGRLLWGSDWPPLELAAGYAVWDRLSAELLAGLDAADRALVYGGTAARVYRLEAS